MNLITLTGNLGRDWEQANASMTIAKNSLAVRRDFKNKKTGEYDTDWIPLTAFSKTAETLMKYTGKGSKVLVIGKLQTNNYTDKQGNKRTSYDVIVDRFEFLDSKNDNQKNYNPQSNQGQRDRQQTKSDDNPFANVDFSNNDPFANSDEVTDILDDDLPFD